MKGRWTSCIDFHIGLVDRQEPLLSRRCGRMRFANFTAMLVTKRDADTAKRFFRKGVGSVSHGEPAYNHHGQEPRLAKSCHADFAEACAGISYAALNSMASQKAPRPLEARVVRTLGRHGGDRMALMIDPRCNLQMRRISSGWKIR